MKNFLHHLLKELLKFVDEIPPKDPYKEWKKRLKKPDQLTTQERKQWYEEQEQIWKDYEEGLL